MSATIQLLEKHLINSLQKKKKKNNRVLTFDKIILYLSILNFHSAIFFIYKVLLKYTVFMMIIIVDKYI